MIMIAYVFLLAAATPADKAAPPIPPAYGVTCWDGSTAYNIKECPVAKPPKGDGASAAKPVNNPGSWVTTNDYPSKALREEREGTSGFKVTINANGVVSSCIITASSGSPELDEATCVNVTKRARFSPAVDGKGNAIASTYSNRVTWRIPEDLPADYDYPVAYGLDMQAFPRAPRSIRYQSPPSDGDYPAAAKLAGEQGFTKLDLVIDEQGKIAGCGIGKSSGSVSLDEASCPFVQTRWSFQPALDFDGNPTKGRVSLGLGWYLQTEPAVKLTEQQDSFSRPEKNLFVDPGKLTLQFDLDVEGRPLNCASGTLGLEVVAKQMAKQSSDICSIFTVSPNGVRFEPFLDAAGKPVAKTVLIEIELSHPAKPEGAAK
jgi:TonB family protein